MEQRARRPAQLDGELDGELGADEHAGCWPWEEMQSALEASGVEAVRSNDAGQFVCESTYWSLLNYREASRLPEFAGFLHVPHESEEYDIPRIALAVGQVVDARWAGLSSAWLSRA